MKKIILVSSSTRRINIMKILGFDIKVIIPCINEEKKVGETGENLVLRLANEKINTIKEKFNIPLISADTIVKIKNNILGKPKNYQDAFNMLKLLSGKEHMVLTAFAIKLKKEIKTQIVKTKVLFRELSNCEILAYIKKDKIMDKAGAYSVQDYAATFIESINGSYSNVLGLPVSELLKVLVEIQNV